MPSGNVIHSKGMVVEVLKHGAYRIQLSNGHRCIARASGELRLEFVRLTPGDAVHLEFNPYDLSRARIVVAR
jgi:translation initiation factor IF-1